MEKNEITNLFLALLEEELLRSLVRREIYGSGDMNGDGSSGRARVEWKEPTWARGQ